MGFSDGIVSWMIKPLIYLFIGYCVFLALLYLFQDRLLFLPEHNVTTTPKVMGLDYEDVYFTTSDGVILHGWFIPAQSQIGVVLFSHGNGGNISHRLEKIKMLQSLRLSVFIYDYRGYGKSKGKPSEQGTYIDALSAWDYLLKTKGINPNQIILYGESLGSAVSIALASKVPALALISEGGFTSLKELAQRIYPYIPARYLCKYEYDSINKIGEIKMPILIIHSVDDEIVPYSMAKELFDKASEPKMLVQLSGGHNDGFFVSRERYIEGIRCYLLSIQSPFVLRTCQSQRLI